jgi:hypothetical protein
MTASAMASAESRRRTREGGEAARPGSSSMNSAIAAIQKARNGRSASKELPFTTNAGTARNRRAAHNG